MGLKLSRAILSKIYLSCWGWSIVLLLKGTYDIFGNDLSIYFKIFFYSIIISEFMDCFSLLYGLRSGWSKDVDLIIVFLKVSAELKYKF